ncbi:MAG TPA: VOC family protein [Thermoanaerobaculia bacterium]|nr:VOC family protein [Thermoanaerobaculia bacterium]
MSTKIFVNLPVADLDRSMTFFRQLGYRFDTRFCDDTAACVVISDDIHAMLLTHAKFRQFSPNAICDAREATEVLVCLSCDSREQVDEMVAKAVAAGGNTYNPPQDHGWMYGHGFQDPDGHIWELAWMDESAIPQA